MPEQFSPRVALALTMLCFLREPLEVLRETTVAGTEEVVLSSKVKLRFAVEGPECRAFGRPFEAFCLDSCTWTPQVA